MRVLAAIAGVLASFGVFGDAVYRSVGEHGETVFSDAPTPGSELVEQSDAAHAPVDARAAAAEIDRVLAVANDLEESRLKREAARAEARAKPAEPEPPPVYEERRSYYVPYRYPHRPHPRPPKEEPVYGQRPLPNAPPPAPTGRTFNAGSG